MLLVEEIANVRDWARFIQEDANGSLRLEFGVTKVVSEARTRL